MWILAALVAVGLGVALARWFEKRVNEQDHPVPDSHRFNPTRDNRDFNSFLGQIRRKSSRIR